TGCGVPIKAYGVAHPMGHNLQAAAIRVNTSDGSKDGVFLIANVAWCSNGHIQLTIGAKGYVLPAVVLIGREGIGNQHRRRRVGQGSLYVIKPVYLAYGTVV